MSTEINERLTGFEPLLVESFVARHSSNFAQSKASERLLCLTGVSNGLTSLGRWRLEKLVYASQEGIEKEEVDVSKTLFNVQTILYSESSDLLPECLIVGKIPGQISENIALQFSPLLIEISNSVKWSECIKRCNMVSCCPSASGLWNKRNPPPIAVDSV